MSTEPGGAGQEERRRLFDRAPRRWPPLQPISPDGRIAGYTTSICALVVGVAYTLIGVKFVFCVHACRVDPGLAGLLVLLFVPITALSVWGVQNVARRTVSPGAYSAWRFGLSFLFVLGIAAAVSRVPNATCPAGFRYFASPEKCIGPQHSLLDPTRWVWLKDLIMLTTFAVGAIVMPVRRLVRFTWVIAAVAWLAGTTMLAASWFTRSG